MSGLKDQMSRFLNGDWRHVEKGWLSHRETFRQKTRDKFFKFIRKSCKNFLTKARSCPEKLKYNEIELIRNPVSNSTCEEIDKKLDNTILSLQKWIDEFSEPCKDGMFFLF